VTTSADDYVKFDVSAIARRRPRLHPGVAFGVILWWLYFPFLGLLGGPDSKLLVFVPVLPGILAGMAFHGNYALEALASWGATVMLIAVLTFFGRRGYLALAICSVVAFLSSTVAMVILRGVPP
jgi:hypothetical protein